jgi:AcrR family transcriptional regulator
VTAEHQPDNTPKRRGRPPSGGREAIVVAALELVRERGIALLTTREVAARAGVSDASIYYHFGDRAGLLRAIYEHGMKPLALTQNPEAGTDLRVVIERFYAALVTFFEDVLPILHAAQADSELGQEVAAYISEQDLGPHKGVIALGAYLRGEQSAGRVNPEADPEAVALMVIDTAFSRVSRRQFMMKNEDPRLPVPERELAMIIQLLQP